MKKILILTALTVSVVVLGYGISYAQEPLNEGEPRPVPIEDNNILPPPREEFDMKQRPVGLTPAEFNKHKKGPIHEHIKGPRPSKAEMEAKKAEFEKRLNLTEKQKKHLIKFSKHMFVGIMTVLISLPIMFVVVNKSIELTIQNYKDVQNSFEKLYESRNQGRFNNIHRTIY